MLNNLTQVSYNNLFSENDTNLFFLNLPFLFLVYFQIIFTRTTTKVMKEMTNKTKNDRASFFRSSQSIGEEYDCFCCS